MEPPSAPAAPYLAGPSSPVLLPSLELRDATGERAPLWDYRGRGPLLVLLHDGLACAGCAAYLDDLAQQHRHYRELGAQVLAIGETAVAGVPFPTLVDAGGRLRATLVARGALPVSSDPALLVVGRTGAVWAAWCGPTAALPDAAARAEWLEYALSECRECFCCELAWPADWVRGAADA